MTTLNPEPTASPLPPHVGAPPFVRRTSTSQHRTVVYLPCLRNPLSTLSPELKITCSRKDLRSVAVAFAKSSLLHTQLEKRRGLGPAITTRLTELDPEPRIVPLLEVTRALWNCLFLYFASGSDSPDHYLIELPLPSPVLYTSLLSLGAQQDPNSGEYKVTRSAIWQLYHYAHALTDPLPFPHVPTTSPPSSIAPTTSPNEHPLRPMKPFAGSTIYSRHIPHIDSFFKLSVCGKDDLPTLHGWLNDARVDKWWGDAGTMEAHEKFLEERRVDAHVIPVIGSYVTVGSGGNSVETCEEATYSEVYWVKEDRLAELVPAQVQDYDRGIHMLVGSNAHRGPHRVRAWLPSLVHYCFLDDPRTQRVLAEPNELNTKMLTYLESVGFVRHGSVVFPHKTSALMICDRTRFYELCPF